MGILFLLKCLELVFVHRRWLSRRLVNPLTGVWSSGTNALFVVCSRCSSLGTCLDPETKLHHLFPKVLNHTHFLDSLIVHFPPFKFLLFPSSLVSCYLLYFQFVPCSSSTMSNFHVVLFSFLQTKFPACLEKALHTAQRRTRWAEADDNGLL